ncbi:ankyrin repeat protein [Pandoravirus inopinatum]|uniref:Ankyrin repeat protein n=1 Tax=Pandoravirus inopinatum TaxID=1605721 RepID=A0A0B5J6P1_9VIRU|nr:ankyrin repeat protein [Pandoravirus inopinatum]AJF97440.1 ankyrin repeat protein [Pandoravirus inopinatum]
MSFGVLPEELVARILAAVPCLPRIRKCTLVCSMWHRLIHDKAAMGGELCLANRCTLYGIASTCQELGAPREHRVTLTDQAAVAGHVACLEYAQARKFEPMRVAFLLSVFKGRTEALDWLATYGRPDEYADDLRSTALSDMAIRSGSVECLDRVLSLGAVLSQTTACATAAAAGHLPMLVHLRAKGCAWTDEVCRKAAKRGSIECLMYAHQSGLSLDLCDVHHAIMWHRNDIVMYLWANGHTPTAKCMDVAARFNNIECFAYAHAAGIPFDALDWESLVSSSYSYHLDILRYACAHGWTPTARCLVKAARAGQRKMVRCLVDHGGCRPNADALVAAVKSRSTGTVGYLLDSGCPGRERACEVAILCDNAEMLRCVHERGCPWDIKKCLSWACGRRAMTWYIDAHLACVDGQCIK